MPEQLTYRNYWDYRTGDATYSGEVIQINKAVTESADVEVLTEYLPTYYATRTETWDWASMFDGTTIYRNGAVEAEGDEGTIGSFTVSPGDVVTTTRPVGMMAPAFGRSVLSDVNRGRKFGVYTSRYQPHTFAVYAIETATVTYEHVAGHNPRSAASVVDTQVISAGSTYAFSNTSEGSHYFTATGDVVISSVPASGDGLALHPVGREALHWRNYAALEYEGDGSLNVTFATGYTSAVFLEASVDVPEFSGNSIADGSGGDTDPFVPVANTAPGYLIPHEVADFVLVSIEACTITAEYWNGSGWTVYNSYGFGTASRGTPHAVQIGATSGVDPAIASGPWRFASDNGAAFYMRLNDPATNDEYSPHGFWLSGRDQLFVTGNLASESVEVQSDEAFLFDTVDVSASDTCTVDSDNEDGFVHALATASDSADVTLVEAFQFATVAVSDSDTLTVDVGSDDATFASDDSTDDPTVDVSEAFDLFVTLSASDTCATQVTDEYTLLECSFSAVDTATADVTEAFLFSTTAVSGDDTATVDAENEVTATTAGATASDTLDVALTESFQFATVTVTDTDAPTVDTTGVFAAMFVTLGDDDTATSDVDDTGAFNDVFLSFTDALDVAATGVFAAMFVTATAFDNNLAVTVGEATGDEFVTFSSSDEAAIGLTEERDFATVEVVDDDTPSVSVTDTGQIADVFLNRAETLPVIAQDVYTLFVTFDTATDNADLVLTEEGEWAVSLSSSDTVDVVATDTADPQVTENFPYASDAVVVDAADATAQLFVALASSELERVNATEARDFATVEEQRSDEADASLEENGRVLYVQSFLADTTTADVSEASALAITHFVFASDGLGVQVDTGAEPFVPRYASDSADLVVDEDFTFSTTAVVDDDTVAVGVESDFDFATVDVTASDELAPVVTEQFTLDVYFSASDVVVVDSDGTATFQSAIVVADSDAIPVRAGIEKSAILVTVLDDDTVVVEVSARIGTLLAVFSAQDTTQPGVDEAFVLNSYFASSDDAAFSVEDVKAQLLKIALDIVGASTSTLTKRAVVTDRAITGSREQATPGLTARAATSGKAGKAASTGRAATVKASKASNTARAASSKSKSAQQSSQAGTSPNPTKGTTRGDGTGTG